MGSKKQRHRLREALWQIWGERCYWCGEPMILPARGQKLPPDKYPRMASIEYHLQKVKGSQHPIHLRLTHVRCNR